MRTGKEAETVRLGTMSGGDFENDFLGDNLGVQCVEVSVTFWSGGINCL